MNPTSAASKYRVATHLRQSRQLGSVARGARRGPQAAQSSKTTAWSLAPRMFHWKPSTTYSMRSESSGPVLESLAGQR